MPLRAKGLGLGDTSAHIADMNRRNFLLTCAATTVAFPALARAPQLAEIDAYLNSFTTAESFFTQINGDGTITTGKLAMRRPGRARFDYDQDDTLVIVGGGQVAIFDPVSRQRPEQYPLRRTPLAHILARQVDITSSGLVKDFRASGSESTLVLQDPEHPEYGTLSLYFRGSPVGLSQWVTTNELGEQTTVVFDAFRTGIRLGSAMFSIPTEMDRRGLN